MTEVDDPFRLRRFVDAQNPVFEGVLAELRRHDYAGWLVVEAEQDPANAHPLTYARMGYANLKAAAERSGVEVSRARMPS